ncbi:FUSC family protein [Mucilaginibacter koreensis]
MKINSREFKSFFYSQYFSDGLRITAGLLLPAAIFAQLNRLDLGLTLSLGAISTSVVDTPGPVVHKRTALLVSSLLAFVIAVITGFVHFSVLFLGIEITICCFLFSMLNVYGNRAASVGTAAILTIIFVMDRDLQYNQIFEYSFTLLGGGIWYTLMSLTFFGIRPYRAAEQALAENITDIVKFLRIKGDFYLPETNIDENYHKLVNQQVLVSQHQDVVRELLFKSRLVVKESTNVSRMLLLMFVDLVDLFEQIMATHYDYATIREKFAHTGVLPQIGKLSHRMADELDNVGYALLTGSNYKPEADFGKELEALKLGIDEAGNTEDVSNLVLKKILINLRDLNQKIINMGYYYNARSGKKLIETNHRELQFTRFVSHQDYSPRILIDNLSFKSATFKHSLRVSMACLAGFVITKSSLLITWVNAITGKHLVFGHHSYWVILTIIVILKPGFSLSKQRNIQRLTGTIAGGLIGVLILTVVHNSYVQFLFLAIFMIGAYSFNRTNYVISVIFMTPYVLILFKFLGVGHLNIAEERIADTIIGSLLSFLASYLLFPSWESDQIKQNLADVLNANINYLMKIADEITGTRVSITDFKLARKDVYVKSANLSAAFQRMTSEPKSKQHRAKDVHKFVVLNHILSSYLATIASGFSVAELHKAQAGNLKLVKRSISTLGECSRKLGGQRFEYTAEKPSTPVVSSVTEDDNLIKDQLNFITKISSDIAKITENILAAA